jgi:16S rRNA (uracil1498-N3)-methyltransferase
MPRRFHIPQPWGDTSVLLPAAEAHHLAHVLRMRPGDQAVIFDGAGGEALAEIVEISPASAELKILQRQPATTETPFPVTVASAVPKGDRFRWMVEKLTELGVHRLVPIVTRRSIVDPREGKLDRLRQTIVEASKQCGRSRLMELETPIHWTPFLAGQPPEQRFLVAHPSGEPWDPTRRRLDRPITVAIGPEGGFTDEEVVAACAAGGELVSLGPRILRIETAAVAVASLLTLGTPS